MRFRLPLVDTVVEGIHTRYPDSRCGWRYRDHTVRERMPYADMPEGRTRSAALPESTTPCQPPTRPLNTRSIQVRRSGVPDTPDHLTGYKITRLLPYRTGEQTGRRTGQQVVRSSDGRCSRRLICQIDHAAARHLWIIARTLALTRRISGRTLALPVCKSPPPPSRGFDIAVVGRWAN